MRVYLDNCVIQDLKNDSRKSLLDLVIYSKGEFIYCFSEAHIQDLSRDKTDNKFSDMEFMETFVDDNCFYYKKAFLVDNLTPIGYYKRFDWSNITSDSELLTNISEDDTFGELFKSMMSIFSTIPLSLKELSSKDQLPDDMPSNMKSLLEVSNLGEFMSALINYSDTLTEEQKAFKEQLQYLHKNQITQYLNLIGIEGYDGQQITDKEKFRESYANYYLKQANGKGKYRYDLFLDMYVGLEFFGFVQGKPRKQKMLNMINDGRHAFFGGFCDIVVSKDEDFINKTKFIYDLYEIQTKVYSISEFEEYLKDCNQSKNKGLSNLLAELENKETQTNVIRDIEENSEQIIYKKLSDIYFGYFNILIVHSNGNYYFSKEKKLFNNGTLIKEISYCVNQMVDELGLDKFKHGYWEDGELQKDQEKEWHGRTWVLNNDFVIELKFSDKLYVVVGKTIKSKEDDKINTK